MQLRDKVFVVTGAGGGIGREVVRQLLQRGARVAAVDLSAERLAETASSMAGLHGSPDRLSTHSIDVTDAGQVKALPQQVVDAHGAVDGLLNVAGIIQPFLPFAELDDATMHRVMDVNFWGVVHMVQAFLPLLRTRPQGAIVNVSSMGGFVPVPGQTLYGASKAAVKLFTEGLHAELRDTNVAVTVVFPGGIATNITENSGVDISAHLMAPGAKVPPLTPAPDAASAIIRGLVRGSYRVVIGKDAVAMDALSRAVPERAMRTIATQMGALLHPEQHARATTGTTAAGIDQRTEEMAEGTPDGEREHPTSGG